MDTYIVGFIITIVFIAIIMYLVDLFITNIEIVVGLLAVIFCIVLVVCLIKLAINKKRRELLHEVLCSIQLSNIDDYLDEYDDYVTVKSRKTLNSYDDIKYFKEEMSFEKAFAALNKKRDIYAIIDSFLAENEYEDRPQYKYVRGRLWNYMSMADNYRVLVTYISSAGNNLGDKCLVITLHRMNEIEKHPEYLMTKGEYNKLIKQQEKDKIDAQKRYLYDQVNNIIDYANEYKDSMIVKSRVKKIDELVEELFYKTINSIQKISKLESEEWGMIESRISSTYTEITEIVKADKQIHKYYKSEDFARLKSTCNLITESQKEFNEYIDEKARSITQLFGTRVVRNETQHDDVYNYVRAYKKSITPFTAEVSSSVFGSAENNPIKYVLKYFYPNRSQYEIQIERLRVLIEELETLKDAKLIIDNYKKEYDQYIQEVPNYVLDNDESGFYSRLGLALVDESVLNIEYRFTYTSDGGMAQRSFTVPMTEENITELITQLQDKLTIEALTKEQRALMTSKLRTSIKMRDNYTCCMCGNSVHNEPNLLLEIDHIIPISKGGLTQENNLQTLCWKCNRNKGAKLI